MELRFVSPALTELDAVESEVLACSVWEDVRPFDGVASLCDWRFAGRISQLLRSGYLSGLEGEVLLIPGRPRMSFDKILLFGCGPRAAFDEAAYQRVMLHMLDAVAGLRARVAVAELPGRQSEAIAAERSADMLLAAAQRSPHDGRHDVWTLVEDHDARKRITRYMIEERRRVRREL